MDRVIINTRTPVVTLTPYNVVDMVEKNRELVIKLKGKECYDIDEGETLQLRRYITAENDEWIDIRENLTVLYEDSDHYIHTTLPNNEKIYIRQEPGAVRNETGYTENNDIYDYYVIECSNNHNIFAQDIAVAGQEIYVKSYDGEEIASYDDISIPIKYSSKIATSADCITLVSEDETCGMEYDILYTKKYDFLPKSFSRNCLIINGFNPEIQSDFYYFEKKFNPYYYYTIETDDNGNPTELDVYGNPIKHCVFYGDYWWSMIRWERNEKYVNCGYTISHLCKDTSYYNVAFAMSSDSDESTLGTEDYFSETYAKMIEDSLVPEIIDMERVKYSPRNMVNSGTNINYEIITGITIYPHFRKRREIQTNDERLENSVATSGNVYFDSWDIDSETANGVWWNNFQNESTTFNSTEFNTFYENYWNKPDLLGYLNFTDADVYYRKSKISKSFYRLSFYDSKDPIEQKLLYYSTVFLDGTSLYGKYIKQTEEDYQTNGGRIDNKNTIGVFYEGDENKMLEAKLHITNEYNRQFSSEGFNIYLFADDVPSGNEFRTIYMKVEFNHAGNGKTIPLIMWPKNGPNWWSLTIDNFLENLYIPIDIREVDGQYIYVVRGGICKNGHLELALFEPKLDVT